MRSFVLVLLAAELVLVAGVHVEFPSVRRAPAVLIRAAVRGCDADEPFVFQPPPVSAETLQVGNIIAGRVLGPNKLGGYDIDIGIGRPALVPKNEAALLPNATEGRVPGQGWAELGVGEVYETQAASYTDSTAWEWETAVWHAQKALQRRSVCAHDMSGTCTAGTLRSPPEHHSSRRGLALCGVQCPGLRPVGLRCLPLLCACVCMWRQAAAASAGAGRGRSQATAP
jgi:hypothetical protein